MTSTEVESLGGAYESPEGLEDFGTEDFAIPRLTMNRNGEFEDAATGRTWESPLSCVVLGALKQRIAWELGDPDDNKTPLCVSRNHKVGTPDPENFPYDQANLNEDGNEIEQGQEQIVCGAKGTGCYLKEWGSRTDGKEMPWCTEQVTYAIALPTDFGYQPALITFQKTSFKAAHTYAAGFAQEKIPMFWVETEISLEVKKKGNNPYSVPSFVRRGSTEKEWHAEFGITNKRLAEYSRQAGQTQETESVPVAEPTTRAAKARNAAKAKAPEPEADDETTDEVVEPPKPKPSKPKAPPVVEDTPTVAEDDDGLVLDDDEGDEVVEPEAADEPYEPVADEPAEDDDDEEDPF